MKILFSVGELDKELNANTKIVLQLAEYMAAKGNEVAVCGICYYKPCDEKTGGVLLKKFAAPKPLVNSSEAFEDFISKGDRNSLRGQFIKRHPLKSAFLAARYNSTYMEKIEQPLYLKQLKKFAAEFAPDVMVLPYKPVNSFEKVAGSDINVPMVAYQMDPWGLHRIDNADGDVSVIKKECAAFEKVQHIFTTPVLLRQYSENDLYKKYIHKMTAVDFPNVKQSKNSDAEAAIDFDSDYINVVFAGVVADSFRNPLAVLQGLEPLFKAGEKIRVYFMGTNNSPVLDSYIEKYPDNVKFVEKVAAATAMATMKRADVLLNISNKIDNQVPSKIFDYFAMGKPILNLQQIADCPAAEYFAKYPLVFNINSWQQTDAEQLKEFLQTSKDKKVDFETVKQLYKTATVEYVAESMLESFKN